jgi:hypothetical protein
MSNFLEITGKTLMIFAIGLLTYSWFYSPGKMFIMYSIGILVLGFLSFYISIRTSDDEMIEA